jgi:predicted AlkP superfamily phosphohydrolase/phosphomutase
MIWDGAPFWAVQKLINEGALSYLEKIVKGGLFAAASPPHLNCQTPPSLATLFTGSLPELHRVFGFNVPDSNFNSCVTKMYSGFDHQILRGKTIWEHAGEHGKKYVLVSIPWYRNSKGCKFALEGYSNRIARRGAVLLKDILSDPLNKGVLQIGPYYLHISKHEKEIQINYGDTSKNISLLNEEVNASSWQEQFISLETGIGVYIWITHRYSDNEPIIVYSGIWKTKVMPYEVDADFVSQVGAFNGEGHGAIYRNGMFGPTIIDGGSGFAEDKLVYSIKKEAEYFERVSCYVVKKYSHEDLYIFYQPCTDDIGHELMGFCDPQSKAFSMKSRDKIWPYIREVYKAADRHLGSIIEQFGSECTFILSSDHGMAGMCYTIYVNEVFKKCRLLDFDSQGNIDLAKTLALYHPANNGSIWINEAGRLYGKVDESDYNAVLQRAKIILSELTNPESGEKVIADIYETERRLGIGCLFLGAEDGYEFNAGRSASGSIIEKTVKSANHATNPSRESLRGIFAAKGPLLNKEVFIEGFHNKNVYPIICRQLGINIPEHLESEIPPGIY